VNGRMREDHTWKAKCPIFEAIVAGIRGPKLPKKIAHLAFQYIFYPERNQPNAWTLDMSCSILMVQSEFSAEIFGKCRYTPED